MSRNFIRKSLLALAIGFMTLTVTGTASAEPGNRGNFNRGNYNRGNYNRGNVYRGNGNRGFNNAYGGNFNKGFQTRPLPARPVYGAGGWNGYNFGRPSGGFYDRSYGGGYKYGNGGGNFNRSFVRIGGIGISW